MTAQGVVHSDGVVNYAWKFVRSQNYGERLINTSIAKSELIDLSAMYPRKREEMKAAWDRYVNRQMQYYMALPQEARDRYGPPRYWQAP